MSSATGTTPLPPGFDVLERVRVGLNGLLHHPKHVSGCHRQA